MSKPKLKLFEISFIIRGKNCSAQHHTRLIAAYNEDDINEWVKKDIEEFNRTYEKVELKKTAEIIEEISTIRTTKGYDAVVQFMPVE
jgi:hypothetical protein